MSYVSVVLADTPSRFWPLQETSGASVAADLSGNGVDGAYHGGILLGQTGPGALKSIQLDGSTGYVQAPSSGITGQFSCEVLWKNSAGATAGATLIFEQWTSGSTFAFLLGDGFLYMWEGQFSYIEEATWTPISDGGWHHYLGTSDGFTTRIYIDGVLVASTSSVAFSGFAGDVVPVTIGAHESTSPTATYSGNYACAAIYNYTLSGAQAAAHSAAAFAGGGGGGSAPPEPTTFDGGFADRLLGGVTS